MTPEMGREGTVQVFGNTRELALAGVRFGIRGAGNNVAHQWVEYSPG